MYINFTFYTAERAELYNLYQRFEWVTAEQNKDFKDYLDQIAIHNMTLCPPGNGMDCYRTLEALYLGSIPIMEVNELAVTYINLKLPVLLLESLESITEPVLAYIRGSKLNDRKLWNLKGVTVSFWRSVIDELREQLGTEANG